MQNTLDISFLFWNISGIKGKYYGITHSSSDFLKYISQYSIIGIAETWQRKDEDYNLRGYTCFSAIRNQKRNIGKNSGGVIMYVKDIFSKFTKRLNSVSCNILWTWIELTKLGAMFDLLVGTTYISPENSSVHSEEDTFCILETELSIYRNMSSSTKIILMGDFNSYTSTEADFLKEDDLDFWDDDNGGIEEYPRCNKDGRNVNNYGRNLLNLCISSNIHIVNGRLGEDQGRGEETCFFGEQPSLIDYILMDFDLFSMCNDFNVESRHESHHMPLYMTLRVRTTDRRVPYPIAVENAFLPRYNWQHEKGITFLENFNGKNLELVVDHISTGDSQLAVDVLTGYISESARHMQSNRIRGNTTTCRAHEPWFDSQCWTERKNTIKSLREFRKCRCHQNLVQFKENQKNLLSLYKSKKKLYEAAEKQKLLETINDKNSTNFWTFVKGFSTNKGVNGNLITQQQWYVHFFELFNSHNNENMHLQYNEQYRKMDDNIDSMINEQEVSKAVTHLKNRKAPGEDGIPAEFFKSILPHSIECLTLLFNRMYRDNFFPITWGTSLLVPLYKKGAVDSPDNYRGIALLPIFSKIFTNIIYNRLNKWVEENNVICPEQGGFRRAFSTIDSVFVLDTLIEKYLRRPRGRFYCAFVDFTKAFDSINRNALWVKLQYSGIPSKMINMLMAIYGKVEARVLTKFGCTEAFDCPRGVKQGCILSPLLFSLYINDLPIFFSENGIRNISLSNLETSLLLYADDLVLMSESAIGLQKQLNTLKKYCDQWQLKVNEQKTKVVVFRRGGVLRRYEKWFYGNIKLDIATYFSYLGVYFSSVHSFSYNQKFRASKGTKALASLNRLMYRLPDIDSTVLWKLFDTKIKPVLHYGSEIWGNIEAPDIERVQTKFCKKILKIHTRVPAVSVRGETGRFPLKYNRIYNMINYWLRLISMDESRLTKDSYKLQLTWANHDQQCWLFTIKNILFSFGFGEIWINQGPGDINIFRSTFKQRLKDVSLQEWNATVNSMDRLKYYKVIKHECILEPYIDKLDARKKSVLANLRCTGLPFNVIVGVYYNKQEYDTCYCILCNGRQIENEYHFILECKALHDIRKKYIAEHYWSNPSITKYKNLMQRTDKYCLTRLCKYIDEALNYRKQITEC